MMYSTFNFYVRQEQVDIDQHQSSSSMTDRCIALGPETERQSHLQDVGLFIFQDAWATYVSSVVHACMHAGPQCTILVNENVYDELLLVC